MKLPKYKIYLAAADFIIVLLSLALSGLFTITYNYEVINLSYLFVLNFILISSFAAFVFIFIAQYNNLYKLNIFLSRSAHLVNIIKSISYGIVAMVFISFIVKFSFISDSRIFIASFTFLLFFNLFIIRLIILRSVYLKYKNYKILSRNIVIIGAGKCGKILAAKLLFENNYGIKILGFIDDKKPKNEQILSNIKVLGDVFDLASIVKDRMIDEIIIAIDNITYERLIELLEFCNKLNITIRVTSKLFNIIPKKIHTENYTGIPVIDVSPKLNNSINFIFKRIIDLTGAAGGLLLFTPLFTIISFIIKISSPGPVLYKQVRIGKNGIPFLFYKFRSMTLGEEDDSYRKKRMIEFIRNANGEANDTKIINNSRVTKIGKFIRKTSLDELPQLINVLKGEMSLVGPRPCLPYEYDNYDKWQKRRQDILPGCTGVWQVAGRSNVSFNDSVVMDLYYVNNMSPWLDLQLIIKTVPVMVFGRGGK